VLTRGRKEKRVDDHIAVLKSKMDGDSFARLMVLENPSLHRFVARYVELGNPDNVVVLDDSPEAIQWMRDEAVRKGEERPIGLDGQTIHYDGYFDQARDKKQTKYLLPPSVDFGAQLNSTDREEGLKEIHEILDGAMAGKTLYVRFFTLGPVGSVFSISCVQLTDSAYVAHSENILYRPGYEQFQKLGASEDYFRFVHSAGELKDARSVNVDKRRIYIDLQENIVYSANTQYAGNTVGLKKLAMRLGIQRSASEGWLTEHMFVMGVKGPAERTTYLTGAFPSACGKTSTSMLPGETIIGDDIAYLRLIDGQVRAVNVEKGIFGIIRDVNEKDDPVIFEVLTSPGEAIFSNVLVTEDNTPRWLGDGRPEPEYGHNHSGEWRPGKKDDAGNAITMSHKNARYTIPIARLSNRDPMADDPRGVPVGGFIYGGRDSDTTVPVEQAFDWDHGIVTKAASLESETTAATLGQEGVRRFNLMSILDFLAYPMGEYIENNLRFGHAVDTPPLIFGVNYFLKGSDGEYLNGMLDKRVWVQWMERRIHGELKARRTPTGLIPLYEDLKELFATYLDYDYTLEEYNEQFKIRIPELLAKVERIEKIYAAEKSVPTVLVDALRAQRERLMEAQKEHGDYVLPESLPLEDA
jgi:phosphoenolpyruvate carboxykinase (GTP)